MNPKTKPEKKALRKARRKEITLLTRGRTLGLSLPRRFVGDLLSCARRVPSVPMQRHMRLADVMAARAALPKRVSWCAIFLKAYALVAAERPMLRRSYLSFPWPRLYEHPMNVASFGLERTYGGDEGVLFAQIPRPETISLLELDARVRYYKVAPLETVASFRRTLKVSRLPMPLRRFVWWAAMSANGTLRSALFGTFGVSVVGSLGAGSLHILSPMTTTLNYGTFDDGGEIDVRLTYDHRVLDGSNVARALGALEDALHGPVLEELRAMACQTATAEGIPAAPVAKLPEGARIDGPHLKRAHAESANDRSLAET